MRDGCPRKRMYAFVSACMAPFRKLARPIDHSRSAAAAAATAAAAETTCDDDVLSCKRLAFRRRSPSTLSVASRYRAQCGSAENRSRMTTLPGRATSTTVSGGRFAPYASASATAHQHAVKCSCTFIIPSTLFTAFRSPSAALPPVDLLIH